MPNFVGNGSMDSQNHDSERAVALHTQIFKEKKYPTTLG